MFHCMDIHISFKTSVNSHYALSDSKQYRDHNNNEGNEDDDDNDKDNNSSSNNNNNNKATSWYAKDFGNTVTTHPG